MMRFRISMNYLLAAHYYHQLCPRTHHHLHERRVHTRHSLLCHPRANTKKAQSKDIYGIDFLATHLRAYLQCCVLRLRETFRTRDSDHRIISTFTISALHFQHHLRTNHLTRTYTLARSHWLGRWYASSAPISLVFKKNVCATCLPKCQNLMVLYGPMRKAIRIFTELCNTVVRHT